MLALCFDDSLKLKEVPLPRPEAGEALIRVRLAGICQTDINVTRGYKGFQGILGHEFVGQVVAAPVPEWVGRRVVGEINLSCGRCPRCLQGLKRHCRDRRILGLHDKDGALAEYITLPLANLHPVPASVPDAFAVFTEPLAAALEILEQSHITPDARVLIVGDGKLGLLVALVLRLNGCDLHLVGRHPEKMDLVVARGVRTHLAESLLERDFDVVVEASGSPEGWQTALSAVRPRGLVVAKSTYHEPLPFNPTALVVPEINVSGSRCGPFAPALRLLARRLINPKKLISRVYPLSQAVEACHYAAQRGVLKVLVEMPTDEIEGSVLPRGPQ
ncbi:MAG: zinc-binding dehydrogenase [Deltaproteobacteria bacterium]|nr:zinc-binding dehydrogenase [Deltaproteobacteria bacterium]